MRQNINWRISGKQEITFSTDGYNTASPSWGENQKVCQPPVKNLIFNLPSWNAYMLLNRMMY